MESRHAVRRHDSTPGVGLEVPPWPRPPWLIEQAERMRYPRLWEKDNGRSPMKGPTLHILGNQTARCLG